MIRFLLLPLFVIISCAAAIAQTPTPATVTVTSSTLTGMTGSEVCPDNAALPVGTVFTATSDAISGLPGYETTVSGTLYFLVYISFRNNYSLTNSSGNIFAVISAADMNGAQGTYTPNGCTGTFGIDEVLPITLTSFTGEYNNKSIDLKWHTAQESGNEGFEVQRSTEGQDWTTLDFVASISGGDSGGHYSFADAAPLPGVNYYRLKQMDYDGSYAFNEVISVVASSNEGLLVFPNPARDMLSISFDAEEAAPYRVVTTEGVEVLRGMLSPRGDVSVEKLPAGTYLISVEGNAGVLTQRFIKQ